MLCAQDPTKVDRSGAYIARQAAKSVVASKLARRCLVQVCLPIRVMLGSGWLRGASWPASMTRPGLRTREAPARSCGAP